MAGPYSTTPPSFAARRAAEHDPTGRDPHAPGAKLDAGKLRAWLMAAGFSRALEEVAKVTTAGAAKYTPNGWRSVPDAEARYLDAGMRHLLAYGRGERIDSDTGCLHLAQAAWNLLAVLDLSLSAKPTDPLSVPQPARNQTRELS